MEVPCSAAVFRLRICVETHSLGDRKHDLGPGNGRLVKESLKEFQGNLQGGPLAVMNGVITPINGLING